MKVVLTNDDGPRSPLLLPLAEQLAALGWEVQMVVPAENNSWIGQAVTRHAPIFTTAQKIGEFHAILVSGTPADCASLGIYNISNTPPDLVISGINVGTNTGAAFFGSSGTVGAATMAALSGSRAIALSAVIPREIFALWMKGEYDALQELHADWTRLARLGADICRTLLESWDADAYSVNFGFDALLETPRRQTQLERSRFGQIFQRVDEGKYLHKMRPLLLPEQSEAGDISTIDRGEVSITPLRLGTP